MVIHRRGVMKADGVPVELGDSFYPADRFPDFDRVRAAHSTITAALAIYGIEDYDRQSTEIEARMPSADEARLLRQPKSLPVLVITKVEGSGGAVTAQTCKEQLLYEVHDPRRYIQPDVVADFSQVKVEEIATDRVRISGGRGTRRTDTLKVSVGYVDSFIGEGQISYAGPGALARGRLALDIVRERLKLTSVAASELRFDLIGVDSLHGPLVSAHANEPYEVRVRVAGRTETLREAVRIGNEVETLYTNGPAGGGGAWKSARDVVAVASVLLPRELATPSVRFVET